MSAFTNVDWKREDIEGDYGDESWVPTAVNQRSRLDEVGDGLTAMFELVPAVADKLDNEYRIALKAVREAVDELNVQKKELGVCWEIFVRK